MLAQQEKQINIKELAIPERLMREEPMFVSDRDVIPALKQSMLLALENRDQKVSFITNAGAFDFAFPNTINKTPWEKTIFDFSKKEQQRVIDSRISVVYALRTLFFAKRLVPEIKVDKKIYDMAQNALSDAVVEEYHDLMFWTQFVFPQLKDKNPHVQYVREIREMLDDARDNPSNKVLSEVAAKAKTIAPELLKKKPLTPDEWSRMIDEMTYSKGAANAFEQMFYLQVLSADEIICHPDGPEFVMTAQKANSQSPTPMPEHRRF